VLSSFEQELPVIKERMIEAGTGKQTLLGSHAVIGNLGLHELCGAAAKNKMMQWYQCSIQVNEPFMLHGLSV
jgi:hypothetical protein